MNIMKKIFSFFVASIFVLSTFVNVYASNSDIDYGNIGYGEAESKSDEQSSSDIFDYSAPPDPAEIFGVEKVSTEDLSNRLNSKGNDIINLIQIVGRYICYGGFIMGAIIMIIGCVGNKRMITQGLIAIIISSLCYVGIVYGREIVTYIGLWAAS